MILKRTLIVILYFNRISCCSSFGHTECVCVADAGGKREAASQEKQTQRLGAFPEKPGETKSPHVENFRHGVKCSARTVKSQLSHFPHSLWFSGEVVGSHLHTLTRTKKVWCSLHSLDLNFLPEPPQDLDPQMRTKTRPRWKWLQRYERVFQRFWSPPRLFILILSVAVVTSRSYSSTSFEDAVKKAEEPPTPPPRPQKTHSRASSLDLNKLFQQGAPGALHKVNSRTHLQLQCLCVQFLF